MHGGWGTDDHGEWENERGACAPSHIKCGRYVPGVSRRLFPVSLRKKLLVFDMHAWPERYKINRLIIWCKLYVIMVVYIFATRKVPP